MLELDKDVIYMHREECTYHRIIGIDFKAEHIVFCARIFRAYDDPDVITTCYDLISVYSRKDFEEAFILVNNSRLNS